MMTVTSTGRPLSAFAGELLSRVQENLIDEMGDAGRGAFGRVVQEAVELAMQVIDLGLRRNPGAGIPDCWCVLASQRCACEIKYTDDGKVALGIRDVQGMQLGGDADGSRLVVIDIQFPARLWVLDAQNIEPGAFQASGHAHLQEPDEADRLAIQLERLLRLADTELVTGEADAKDLLREVARSS